MSFMRFSAAPAGRLGDPTIPWAIFGDRPDMPDGLEDSALAGANLAQIASSPGAPMFDPDSLFGAHMAAQPLGREPDAPVVVFVHGFGHEPRRPVLARVKSDNPHRCIYHFEETPGGPGSAEERRRHLTPWFARAMLAGGSGGPEECPGLAVGYSYASRGGAPDPFLPGRLTRTATRAGFLMPWRQPAAPYVNAYHDAEQAGFGLAALITQLRFRLDQAGMTAKPIDILCHGLGARCVLSALAMIAQRWPNDGTLARIGRVIILDGACYWGQAAYALANILFADAPRRPEIFNVTSQVDEVLHYLACRATMRVAVAQAIRDLSLEGRARRLLRGGRTIGRHGAPPHELYEWFGDRYPEWVDIPLDAPRVRRWGRRRGLDLRGRYRPGRGDHWLCFTHPGNWGLYRAILNRAADTAPADLAASVSRWRPVHPLLGLARASGRLLAPVRQDGGSAKSSSAV